MATATRLPDGSPDTVKRTDYFYRAPTPTTGLVSGTPSCPLQWPCRPPQGAGTDRREAFRAWALSINRGDPTGTFARALFGYPAPLLSESEAEPPLRPTELVGEVVMAKDEKDPKGQGEEVQRWTAQIAR